MDAKAQHERFRRLVKKLVEARREYLPESAEQDWVVFCYESQQAFEKRFPDRGACEQYLQNLEARSKAHDEDLSDKINRLRRQGFSYLDREALRYDFPCHDQEGDSVEADA